MTNTTHTVHISCDCATCAQNAEALGRPFPLSAFISESTAAKLGITAKNATRATKTHGTIYFAHDPRFAVVNRLATPVTA